MTMTETDHKVFTFSSDPGHGWLLVTRQDMVDVGLTEVDISPYSYQHGDTIALEEDCDATVFLTAWEKKHGRPAEFKEKNNGAQIRNWRGYGTKP